MSFNITTVLSVIGALILFALFIYIIVLFNNYIILKNLVKKSSANIDVLLKQRFDELPNLVAAVKGYAKHETELLLKITDTRVQIMSSGMNKKAEASASISKSIKSIFAVAENYPRLRANENFLKLQQRISSIESDIALRREFYNDSVTNYNIWIETFPNSVLASLAKANKAELFSTDAKEVEVKF